MHRRECSPWLWLAMDAKTRQVIAFHIGDRSRESAQQWHVFPAHCGHHLNSIEGFWRAMKDAIGAGRCFADRQQLYQRTHRVRMTHQERLI
jgi:IS1 family transposase